MQNNENNCEGADREERKKNKILISNSKREFGKGSFIYDVCKKCQKFGFIILISIKVIGKRTDFYQPDFCECLMEVSPLQNYKSVSKLYKRFQDGNSVIESK